MKKAIMFLMGIAVAVTINLSCGGQHEEKQHDHSTHSEQQAAASFQCPMKCEGDKTYTEAGDCPVCGMALVKIEK